jgi:hypothetical protein
MADKKEEFNQQSMDAEVWAEEFMRLFGKSLSQIDEGLMLSWFANAIMAGYDEARRRHENPASKRVEELERENYLLIAVPGQMAMVDKINELCQEVSKLKEEK